MKKIITIILLTLSLTLTACGGDSDVTFTSGMLVEGTLIQGEGTTHDAALGFKHSSGTAIENVQICGLERCSTTDGQGQWGFVANEDFKGGSATFTVKGHGIDTTTAVQIPLNAKEVFLDLKNIAGKVSAEHITADGETSHQEDESNSHEE